MEIEKIDEIFRAFRNNVVDNTTAAILTLAYIISNK